MVSDFKIYFIWQVEIRISIGYKAKPDKCMIIFAIKHKTLAENLTLSRIEVPLR